MNNLLNYGQHFLIDKNVVSEFLQTCALTGQESVLEIGPGEGVITRGLVKEAKTVTTVEIDIKLRTSLKKLEKQHDNLQVIFDNALKLKNYHYDLVCGALSFAIFEPLIIKLSKKTGYQRLVFLVSYKVKDDFAKEQGLLFYLLNSFFKISFGHKILPQSFAPKPRTSGVIISLVPQMPVISRFMAWRKIFDTDKTIWQKTCVELAAIDRQILYT